MSHLPDTRESEAAVPPGEMGMVLRELTRMGKAIDLLAQEMREGLSAMRSANDERVGKLEERVRVAEIELAKVTVKIGLASGAAALLGAVAVEFLKSLIH